MGHRYEHIIAPLKIGNVVLKNRLLASRVVSQELQGPENFPAESTIRFIADLAKNGAAIVTCPAGDFLPGGGPYRTEPNTYPEERRIQSYFVKMIDRIHAHNSLASVAVTGNLPVHAAISAIEDGSTVPPGPRRRFRRAMQTPYVVTKDQIRDFIEDFAWRCVCMKLIGFDMVNIYMSYSESILADSLSPVYNQRKDEYGGSAKNRARLTLELFTAIKEVCGPDFLIEAQVSPIEGIPSGFEVAEWLDWCRMCEGLVDIFQIRHPNKSAHHVSPYNSTPESPFTLPYAEAFKKRGIKAIAAPGGGFQDLDLIESFIREGKTDMVTLGRAFICDPEYGKKLYEGRGEDVVPCIRCDKCHGAVCSVNPEYSLSHVIPDMFEAVKKAKKVAVIGGGPAGMRAAIEAADRGHEVTLYERAEYLGGQLRHADFMGFKKELKNYKDYLIRQLGKKGVKVHLGKEATPEIIKAGSYDAVIAACGSEAKIGDIPGADGKNVRRPIDVFGNEDKLGQRIVVIGGASIGSETALYLARLGRSVTLITRQKEVAYDDSAHGHVDFVKMLHNETDVRCKAITQNIEAGAVIYNDEAGVEHRVECDSVVFSAGRRPRTEECFEFAGLSDLFFVIGDSNIHTNRMFSVFSMPVAGKSEQTGANNQKYPPAYFIKNDAGEYSPLEFPDGDVRHATITAFFAANEI